jgi:hypothetical protein
VSKNLATQINDPMLIRFARKCPIQKFAPISTFIQRTPASF